MNYEIYAYWNTAELAAIFNALASITNSGDYLGLVRTIALIVIISLAIVVLAGRGRLDDFWKWVFMVAIFNGVMLTPKATVMIVDRTGTSAVQTVANVPLGLAAITHTTSKIGDWLTTAFETVFALPDDVQFRKSGSLFGHRVLQEINTARTTNPVIADNMTAFFRECVWPEFGTGFVHAKDLIHAPDMWSYLSGKTNPGRLVEIKDPTTGITQPPQTCPDAYTSLTTHLNGDASNVLDSVGKKLNPGIPAASINALISSQITTSTGFLLSASQSAMDSVRQGMVMNAFVDAQYEIPRQLGDTAGAMTALANAQSIRSTSESYKVMAAIGQKTMPKFRNVIEMIQYGVAAFALLFIVVLGHWGTKPLVMYVQSLMWVQLWAPLYAIINYIMTLYAQKQLLSLSDGGFSLYNFSYINNATISDQAIAGMIAAVGVPTIAWGLVQGMSMGAHAFGQMMGSPTGAEAARHASAAALGNVSMGNASMANQSAFNTSTNQYSNQPTMRDGAPSIDQQNTNGSVWSTRGATSFVTDQTASSSAHGAIKGGMQVAQSAREMSATALAAAYGQTADFIRSAGSSQALAQAFGTGTDSKHVQAAAKVDAFNKKYAEESGLSQEQVAKVTGMVKAGVGLPAALEAISPVKVGADGKIEGSSAAKQAKAEKVLNEAVNNSEYRDAWDVTTQGFMRNEFKDGSESAQRATKGIQANLTESDNYQKVAERLRSGNVNIDQNLMDDYIRYRQDVAARHGDHIKPDEAIMDFRPENRNKPEVQQRLQSFMKTKATELANEMGIEGPKSKDEVKKIGENNLETVKDEAKKEGLKPETKVNGDPIKAAANGQINAGSNAVDAGKTKVDTNGTPLKQQVTDANDPSKRDSLMGTAVANAGSAVLPSGTVWAVDQAAKAVGADGIEPKQAMGWRQDADHYTGGMGGAIVDTGLLLAGGPMGKIGGKVAGEVVGGVLGKKAAAELVEKEAGTAMGHNYPGLVSIVANEAKQEVVEAGAKAGAVTGMAAGTQIGGAVADARPGIEGRFEGALGQGEQAAAGVGGGMDVNIGGTSNLGSLLGGGQRQMPTPASTGNESGEQQKPGESPPPSGR